MPGWSAVKLIGEGSYGKVYEIERKGYGIEEHSALKVVSIPQSMAEVRDLMNNDGLSEDAVLSYYRGLVDDLVQEIALMSRLKGNTNIVSCEDYRIVEREETIGWDILMRMELLEALPTYLSANSFSSDDALKLGIDICNALEACESAKIIHRDIKPNNIFVNKTGDFKLGDFGVARTVEKTVSGLSKKGTYTFMAPEVYKGEKYGPSADIYSLGMTMYRLLNNNREPFLPPAPEAIKYTDKDRALVERMSGKQFAPPANASRSLSAVILKACAFDPAERYRTAAEMKADLVAIRDSSPIDTSTILTPGQIYDSRTPGSHSPSTPSPTPPKASFEPKPQTDDPYDQTYKVNRAGGSGEFTPAQSAAPVYTAPVSAAPQAPAYTAPQTPAYTAAPAYNTDSGGAQKKKTKLVLFLVAGLLVIGGIIGAVIGIVNSSDKSSKSSSSSGSSGGSSGTVTIVGTWVGNMMIEDDEEFSDYTVKTYLIFDNNGQYTSSFDRSSLKQLLTAIVQAEGATLEEYLEAMGYESFEQLASATDYSGNYEYSDGVLKFDDETSYRVTLTSTQLTFSEFISGNSASILAANVPTTFTKK